jgi:hypothetical protein
VNYVSVLSRGRTSRVCTSMVLRAGLALAALLVVLLFAQSALATHLSFWDDEGYHLLSIDNYLHRGHLYQETYGQYGPFYFYTQAAFFQLLRLPLSHDANRMVTLICWLLSAAFGGYFIYRVSRDLVMASAAALACARLASVLASEPGHPQQLILPIFMLACCASVSNGRGGFGLFLLGAFGAALLFTKINVGVFYMAALANTLICSSFSGRMRALGVSLMVLYALAIPPWLMHRDIMGAYPWARVYCIVAVLVGVGVFLAGAATTPVLSRPMPRVVFASIGFVSTALLIVAGTTLQGISLATLTDGVVVAPLRHPGVFFLPYLFGRRLLLEVALAAVCTTAVYWFRDRGWARGESVAGLRCLVGLWSVSWWAFGGGGPVVLLPFLPLGLLPVYGREWRPSDFLPRLFLASLAATQFLQLYPVAGSQTAIAAAPTLLWALVCVYDGAPGLFALARRATGLFSEGFPIVSVLGGVLALTLIVAMLPAVFWPGHYPYPPSHLRGSASLHLPADIEQRYRFLADSIHANCDILFTMPGMASLNFWSGVPTPNGWNLTGWMKGFNLYRQQQILDILKSHPRGCSVSNIDIARFWTSTPAELDTLPLARYILYDMRVVAERDGFVVRVNPQRDSPWMGVAKSYPRPAGALLSSASPDVSYQ